MSLHLKKHISSLRAYIPPVKNYGNKANLSLNENLFGCAPACIRALQKVKPEAISKYPLPNSEAITSALAADLRVDSDKIVVGDGESEILKEVFHSLLELKDKVLLCENSWSYFVHLAKANNAEIVPYALKKNRISFKFDVKQIVDLLKKEKPKLLIIVSPNMPTGNSISAKDLASILKNAKDTFVVLDEAYLGFSDEQSASGAHLNATLEKFKNLIITRTFSKFYGLASLRIGYALCHAQLADYLRKSFPLFGVNYLAQVAARTALREKKYYAKMRKDLMESKEDFAHKIDSIRKYFTYRSDANFVLVDVGEEADSLEEYLYGKGFVVRSCKQYKLPNCIRITIGPKKIMNDLAMAIKRFSIR